MHWINLIIPDAIASSENVRLAPSLKSQKGAIWTKNPLSFEFWEVDIAFRVSGRGRIGADGLVSDFFVYLHYKNKVSKKVIFQLNLYFTDSRI